jgi:hypothetical protein
VKISKRSNGSGKGVARQKCIPIDSPAEWKEALEGIEHSFAHTWENCYARQLTTGFDTYLYCFEMNDVRIVCPIAERGFGDYTDIVTPYGFSGFAGNAACPEFPQYWTDFVKDQGYVSGYIALNPVFENTTYFRRHEVHRSNSLYFLDLTLSFDALFANLDRNRKRQLRNWENVFSNFIFDRSALTDFFLMNYPTFIRRVNASSANYFSSETLAFLCNLDNVFIVGAGENKRIEAVYLFAYTSYAGDCLFNVALPEGRHHATTLLWCGINYLKSLKIPHLNLGGGVRDDDDIAKAKQRFGGRREPFRCLKQVYRPEVYEELCRRADSDPTDMSGYFPPYRDPLRPSSVSNPPMDEA